MPRALLAATLAVVLVAPSLTGQDLEFEVASIKRNTSDRFPVGGAPANPATGQLTLTWTPARFIVTRAFPDLTAPIVVEGLPGWADSERYDVTVKFRPGATIQEQAQMWRRLLADRMKLEAHYETRERDAYELVLARSDGRLGPNLRPSTLQCGEPDPAARPQPPPVFAEAMRVQGPLPPDMEAQLMSQCRASFNVRDTVYAGAVDMRGVLMAINMRGGIDRPVTDRTGLTGLWAIKLSASRPTLGPQDPDAPPDVFTAIQEQLGLKLVPTKVQGRILVVDHIERPTEN